MAEKGSGPFGWGMGVTCGIIFAICLVIALIVGGCVLIGGGCLAAGAKSVADVAEQVEQARKRQEAEENDPANWKDAGSGPVTENGIAVTVKKVSIGKVRLKDFGEDSMSKDDLLIVELEINNTDKGKKVDYSGWAKGGNATMKDASGNNYKRITFGTATVVGQIAGATSLYPSKPVSDVLVFERPIESAKELRLRLPLSAVDKTGVIRLKIPASMIKK